MERLPADEHQILVNTATVAVDDPRPRKERFYTFPYGQNKIAHKLFKKGYFLKGKSDDGTFCYALTGKACQYLVEMDEFDPA